MTNPYNNFRGSIPMYPDGGVNAQGLTKPQYEQAQTDSMTLYKSGFGKVPNYKFPGFNDAQRRLTEISGIGTGETTIPRSLQGGTGTMSQGSNDFSSIEQYQKPLGLPWKEYIPATEKSGVSIKNTNPSTSYQILRDNSRKITYKDGTTKIVKPGEFKYGGQMPMFKKGGKKVPESVRFVPKMADESEGDNVVVPGVPQYETNYTDVLPPDRYNTFGKPLDNWEAARLNKSAWDEDYMNNPNAKKPTEETNPNSKNFDWGNLAMNVGNFAAQNAGNIYNLSRYNKPEETKFKQTTGKYMDPTKAIAGENYIYRQTKNTLPGLTGGNAGATMALLFANKANTATRIGRLRETYDNANAQIANQVNQYNTGIANQEIIANEQNRARARSGTGEAIGDTAKSFAQMQLDNKKGAMDEDMLEVYKEYYKNPEFRAAMKKLTFGSKKK